MPPAHGNEPAPSDVAAFSLWVYDAFGYDFRDYQAEPLRKSLATVLSARGLEDLGALRRQLSDDRSLFPELLAKLTVTTSSMFRNPKLFATLVREVFPYLRTYSSLKVWHAGCARGEEVYSLAILLKEQQLLERTRIYATDINPEALAAAREGIYPVRRLKEFARNYHAAGGGGHLSDHFELKYDHAKFGRDLSSRILFSKHNLTSDQVFGEMQLVLCRNVLIYFNPSLQERVLSLLRASLCPGGFLSLGRSEAILAGAAKRQFRTFSRAELIYRAVEEGITGQ